MPGWRWGFSESLRVSAELAIFDVMASISGNPDSGQIGAMPANTVWRLADLMGIHKSLRHMFIDPERVYAWIGRPNDAFAGRSALERMLAGAPADITAVRAYLDAERGDGDDWYGISP